MAAGPRSPATVHAVAFVADHRDRAEQLGISLAELVNEPDPFARSLSAGLASLADPAYLAEQQRVAPGIGPVHGVRSPLLTAISRSFRRATHDQRPTPLLFVADRLFAESELESRWLAFDILERTLADEAERTWQLLRRAAREAADWITTDSLAHPYGSGIAAEPYRWAELGSLVYSPSRWERRLVGSTIATMSHTERRRGNERELAGRALPLLAELMGDAEPDVQKALSWAYRALTSVDRPATQAAILDQTDLAVATDDGHRAWVIRDTLSKLDPTSTAAIHTKLVGIRRRPGTPSTSSASETSARFGSLPNPIGHPEPPLR